MDLGSATFKTNVYPSNVRKGSFMNRTSGSFVESINGGLNCRDLNIHQLKVLKSDIKVGKFKSGVISSILTNADKETTFHAPMFEPPQADPRNIVSIILGGGAGTRLFPLTGRRAKPAVPIGGCYRLIDIPMSNCINSGIKKIFIMTQFNSFSLNRHLARTYNFGNGVLAATQTPGDSGKRWFQGTADAVRQFIWVFEAAKTKNVENILILSGDHLYRMDYMDFVQKHVNTNADITVSCLPMDDSRASDFGLMKIDNRGRVIKFAEKPKGLELNAMNDAVKYPYIASMGVYVFKTDVLLKLLKWSYPHCNDFGSEIIPSAVREHNVQLFVYRVSLLLCEAYLFNDYWEDIGTIKSFFDANLALTEQFPKFEFYDSKTPFYTSPRFLPPTKVEKCRIVDAIISHGCFLRECSVQHSIVGVRSRLEYGVELKDTMMMGADYYQTESEIASLLAEGKVPIGVGKNTRIRNCIIDKNAKIGREVIIKNTDGVEEADRSNEGFYIRSGITAILKNATIKDGTII
ncbi:hypothetical protein G4B88_026097 [Cannabis sativa]|uniref:Glucose-1-phosphate adenylyltransferase n=1 Tax=Cannabis sativa TaxID=3483 RepID=A0A7J6EDK1_CANSA|nr:hypothetical protein G4B88_026097 [Cannabis sativa]